MNNQDNNSGWKTHQQVANELGMSRSTMWRQLRARQLYPPKGLLSPAWQEIIYNALNRTPRTNG